MNKLKTKWVAKWAKKHKVDDEKLILAIDNLEDNLSSSNLGGGLFKVRVASKNSGKSGGFRTLIVYREDDTAVVVLSQSDSDLKMAIEQGVFIPLGGDL